MKASSRTRQRAAASGLLLAGLLLTGCAVDAAADHGPDTLTTNAEMMGGGAVMATVPGYQYSPLSCAAPRSLPGQRVDVALADINMMQMMGGVAPMGSRMTLRAVPATVPAGQISLVVSDVGWRTHELVILPLMNGSAAGQRIPGSNGKVPETRTLGEASGSCAAGVGDGIGAGKVGWVTVRLPAGRYELVCNLQNHYADGMHQELTVT